MCAATPVAGALSRLTNDGVLALLDGNIGDTIVVHLCKGEPFGCGIKSRHCGEIGSGWCVCGFGETKPLAWQMQQLCQLAIGMHSLNHGM